LCGQIAPVPVVHRLQLSTRTPQPIYPIALPFEPPQVSEPVCDQPVVVPIQIGEYPTNRLVKAGEILATMEEFTPSGYLLCNGREVSRTTYSLLFKIIGTYYGEGDKVNTFNLPNLSNDTNPNTRYIIKYNNLSPSTEPSTGGGGSNEQLASQVQFLPYPMVYSPIPGTVLYNTLNYVPTGYLACNGAEVSRVDYATLFNMVGTFYGEGDGSTTFNVPNLSNMSEPYRYIIRYDIPENVIIEINPNMVVNSVQIDGTAEINIS
jgi:microcystin-dependent protein